MATNWAWRIAKISGFVFLALLILAAIAITFTVGWRPIIGAKKRPLTSRKFEATPERLRRGEYLVHAVMLCMDCHSRYDLAANPPVLVSAEGAGRILYDQGGVRIVAPNITSDSETGLGKWSDDAIARAIREGIAADGTVLVPLMPYEQFRHMSDEDLASVVVFMRNLSAAHNDLPATRLPFPLTRLIQAVPQPLTKTVPQPGISNLAERGEYLAQMATCSDCHTPADPKFQPIRGMELAGGKPMAFAPDVFSANITPDASGIGYYDETLFIQVMRHGSVRARKLSWSMPWRAFRNMTDDDLKALFAYLRTVKPVHHLVDNTEPPTQCKLCGQKHGLGERN